MAARVGSLLTLAIHGTIFSGKMPEISSISGDPNIQITDLGAEHLQHLKRQSLEVLQQGFPGRVESIGKLTQICHSIACLMMFEGHIVDPIACCGDNSLWCHNSQLSA